MRGNLLTFALLLVLPVVANASQIAIGLDWRENVFVQEYWQDGKARYAIFNNRPEAIKLTVNDVQFVTPRAQSRSAPWTANTWPLGRSRASKSCMSMHRRLRLAIFATCASGSSMENDRACSPSLSPLQTCPRARSSVATASTAQGGRRQDVCYEQDSLTFKSNGVIELRLKLAANGATVTFKKKKSMDNPIEAIIAEAACATLPIQIGKEEITIDTGKPLKEDAVHVVTLRFTAPKVNAPTMVAIDGWVAFRPSVPGLSGGSTHFVRGVVVEPGK